MENKMTIKKVRAGISAWFEGRDDAKRQLKHDAGVFDLDGYRMRDYGGVK